MQVPFSVIDSGGNILRSGACSHKDFWFQAGPGEEVVLGRGSDTDDTVEVGPHGHKVIVRRPEAEISERHAADEKRKNSPRRPIKDVSKIIADLEARIIELEAKQ